VDTSDRVQSEINRSNPWYVAEHLPNINNPNQIRTIRERWNFISKIIYVLSSSYSGKKLKILDAGCGDGINLTILSKMPNAQITACDYNPIRIQRTKKAFPNVKVIHQDLSNVQIDEDSFDIILCSQVLEHVPEDTVVLRELRKMLSPSGILIVGVPNEGCFLARLRNHVLEPYIGRTTDHVHFYTEEELTNKFRSAGFRVKEKLDQNFFFPKQSISNFFASRDWGFEFMKILRRIFPSQAGGYYFALVHDERDLGNGEPRQP
jgi:2-polyprenyl-3-methyl-5-hydroxy-6-metoxy-1,4-benzoquinol methylase